jgi:hypothetical protein
MRTAMERMKTRYAASYETSNGTRNCAPFEYTNLREAVKRIREIASGECFIGETAHWTVADSSSGNAVAEGTVS